MQLKVINLTARIDSINTSDSYSQDVFSCGANLLIPYINLELFEDIEGMSKQSKIDFSYVVLKGVREAQWNYTHERQTVVGRVVNPEVEPDHTDYFIIGGTQRDTGGELKVRFKEMFLMMPPEAKVADKYWIPFKTPNFRRNLSKERVRLFFSESSIPEQVRRLVNCSDEALTKLIFDQNVSSQEAQEIKDSW